jgi:hypothetical protein
MAGDSPGGRPLQIVRADLSLLLGALFGWTVVLGRGKLAKIEVALSNWEDTSEALGGAASEGRQLSWPRHPRCQVRFLPLPVSDQIADVAVGIDEVRAGERALKAERAKS